MRLTADGKSHQCPLNDDELELRKLLRAATVTPASPCSLVGGRAQPHWTSPD